MPLGAGLGCHGDKLTSAGETPLYWPGMEKPWGEKEGASGGARWGPLPQATPPGQGGHPEPTRVTPRWQRLGPLATPCPRRGCGPLPGWQRAGWCPGRGQGGRGWWPPSEVTGEGGKEVEGMRDKVECPRSPLDSFCLPNALTSWAWSPAPPRQGALVASSTGVPWCPGPGGHREPWGGAGGKQAVLAPGLGAGLGGYLQDDGADLPHALDDGVRHPRDGDGPFGGVGQQVAGHLHLRPRALGGIRGRCRGASAAPPGGAQHLTPPLSLCRTHRGMLCSHITHITSRSTAAAPTPRAPCPPRGRGEPAPRAPSASPPGSPGS